MPGHPPAPGRKFPRVTSLAFDDEAARQRMIAGLDRSIFRPKLAKLLGIEPTEEALQEFANKAPDRYWQAVTQAAKLAGFTERQEITGNFSLQHRLDAMSDAEFFAYVEAQRIGVSRSPDALPPKGSVGELEAVQAPENHSTTPRDAA